MGMNNYPIWDFGELTYEELCMLLNLVNTFGFAAAQTDLHAAPWETIQEKLRHGIAKRSPEGSISK